MQAYNHARSCLPVQYSEEEVLEINAHLFDFLPTMNLM